MGNSCFLKVDGARDIPADSTNLGVPHTQMNNRFAPTGQHLSFKQTEH